MTYNPDNVFSKILRGEIPCKQVYSDDVALAFHDVAPAAPVHVLVIPRGEYVSFDDFVAKAGSEAVGRFFEAVQKTVVTLGVAETGYRLITNHGAHAHQAVPHFHVHVLAGRSLGGLVSSA